MRNGRDGLPGQDGDDGASAYEIAVRHGFKGTEKEWVDAGRMLGLGKRVFMLGIDGLDGKDGKDGKDGLPGKDGAPGRDGRPGAKGADGLAGQDGKDGNDGWTMLLGVVEDGIRRVFKIVGWAGGTGEPPILEGEYLGPNGPVADISRATDVRGPAGQNASGGVVYGGGGVSLAEVTALVESLTMEDYDQIPLDDQTAGMSDEVLTFPFSEEVQKIWVQMLASSPTDSTIARVRTDGQDPDSDTGHVITAGVPQPINSVTSEVRVFTPAGKTVSVTGYRRRTT